jgi:teichuronic acid exporter
MTSLKHKTVHGLFWNFLDNFSRLGIGFITGIILARLLTPREFGLVGMVTIFIAISQSIIDSGFTQALIRKKNCTQADYSTVFFFNLVIGILIYFILFLSTGLISDFFNEPKLNQIIPVIGLSIVINSLGLIQSTILTKKLNFKLQTKISVISTVVSGIIGIGMAYAGYGVWSLVFRAVSASLAGLTFLWLWNTWKPSWVFNYVSFREMFSFGSKLLVSGVIDKIYTNIYLLVIGKYFSAAELGYFTRANMFQRLPSENITKVIQRVSYPVLSSIKDDENRLRSGYQKLIKSTMLITFVLMIGMAASAKPMVLALVGDKWLPSVIYLQLLCFVGVFYPLHALNLNVLNVKGRSDLFLKLEIFKKILAIPVIAIGIYYGITEMIVAMIIASFISYFINSYYSGRLIQYNTLTQIKDILPSFLLALANGILIYLIGYFMKAPTAVIYITQIFASIIFVVSLAELFMLKDYLYIKAIVKEKLFKKN